MLRLSRLQFASKTYINGYGSNESKRYILPVILKNNEGADLDVNEGSNTHTLNHNH
jgi:hypothetical protein